MLDRIDLHVDVPRIKYEALTDTTRGESSETIRARVDQVRRLQQARFVGAGVDDCLVNADMNARAIRRFCVLDAGAEELLGVAVRQMHLSGRGYHRTLKVARTIADLAGSDSLMAEHVAEAVQYRFGAE
jgi:magnesium chelatase family protein